MGTPFLSEIRAVSFNFPPKGWAFCNGQLLPISQNQALFSLLGTTYGGNGTTTFALPNLQGRTLLNKSSSHPLGQAAGEDAHTLTTAEIPTHTHVATARGQNGDNPSPAGRAWGLRSSDQTYAPGTSPPVAMNAQAIAPAGGGQSHQNWPPYLVINFVIALVGIFPSRT